MSRLRLDMAATAVAAPVFLVAAVLTHDRLLLVPAVLAVAGFAVSAAAYRIVRRRGGSAS